MPFRAVVVTVLLILGAAVCAWYLMRPEPAVAKPDRTRKRPAATKTVVKVRSDRDWSEVSEAELEEFVSSFGGAKARGGFAIDTVVAPHESVLAEVYESKPGELVFTQLTPMLTTKPDGRVAVDIAIDSFTLSAGGRHEKILNHSTVQMTPGGSATLGHIAYDPESKAPNGMYSVGMAVEFVGDPPTSIRLKASGDYQGTGSRQAAETTER